MRSAPVWPDLYCVAQERIGVCFATAEHTERGQRQRAMVREGRKGERGRQSGRERGGDR